jgi:hypothetical protein
MAIVFSLPWALLIWSYVYSYSNVHLTLFHGIADISDRMLLFLTAVILYSWSVSNLCSRIVIASILAFVFSLLVGCMRTMWEPRSGLRAWLDGGGDGLRLPNFPALQASHAMIARLRDGIMSFRNRFHTVTTDNGSERELAGPRVGDTSGTV